MEKIICKRCGHEMINKTSGPNIVVECPHCGFGWATYDDSLEAEIIKDKTIYHVILEKSHLTLNNIKIIAAISNKNYLESRNLLANGGELIIGFAATIKTIKTELEKEDILFRIEPNYKY